MQYTTDVEGLQASSQRLKTYTDQLASFERDLENAALRLSGARHFGSVEVQAIRQDLKQQKGRLGEFIEQVDYWVNCLNAALNARYTPGTSFGDYAKTGLNLATTSVATLASLPAVKQVSKQTRSILGQSRQALSDLARRIAELPRKLIGRGLFSSFLLKTRIPLKKSLFGHIHIFLDHVANALKPAHHASVWLSSLVNILRKPIEQIANAIRGGFKTAVKGASGFLGLIGRFANKTAKTLVSGFKLARGFFSSALNVGKGLVSNVVSGVAHGAKSVFKKVGGVLKSIGGFLKKRKNSFQRMLARTAKQLAAGFKAALAQARGAFDTVGSFAVKAGKTVSRGFNLAKGLFGKMLKTAGSVTKGFAGIVSSGVSFIKKGFSGVKKFFGGLFGGAKRAFQKLLKKASQAAAAGFRVAISGAKSILNQVAGFARKVGKAVVGGLKLASRISAVVLKTVAKGLAVANQFRRFLTNSVLRLINGVTGLSLADPLNPRTYLDLLRKVGQFITNPLAAAKGLLTNLTSHLTKAYELVKGLVNFGIGFIRSPKGIVANFGALFNNLKKVLLVNLAEDFKDFVGYIKHLINPRPIRIPAFNPCIDPKDADRLSYQPLENATLFARSNDGLPIVSVDDVLQGGLGDCYFIAPMAAMAAQHPEMIAKMITANPDGTYTVRFPAKRRGDWDGAVVRGEVIVTVTPDFPLDAAKNPGYAQPRLVDGKRVIWPLILEKAFAQYYGSYQKIVGGTEYRLDLLTGHESERFGSGFVGVGGYQVTDLAERLGRGDLVVANTASNLGKNDDQESIEFKDGQKIHYSHVYTVSRIEVNPLVPSESTVYLRNPWGKEDVKLSFSEFKLYFPRVTTSRVD